MAFTSSAKGAFVRQRLVDILGSKLAAEEIYTILNSGSKDSTITSETDLAIRSTLLDDKAADEVLDALKTGSNTLSEATRLALEVACADEGLYVEIKSALAAVA